MAGRAEPPQAGLNGYTHGTYRFMLRYLKISNLAIIENVEVEFTDGFNVLTGETGAGKSILIGALDLLLGGKAHADIIRTGEQEATVEGLFEIPDMTRLPRDLDIDRTGELIITRRILPSGRSKATLNGHLASVSMLETVGRSMVGIFGQHEHQTLLDTDAHGEILDRFGNLHPRRQKTARAFEDWKKSARDLARAAETLKELEAQHRELMAIVQELKTACLKEGEEEQLTMEKELLKKAVQIREKAFEAYQTLYARSRSITEELAEVKRAVSWLATTNPSLNGLKEDFDGALYTIEDVALQLRDVAEKAYSDPARLEKIEERLAQIRRLKKKHAMDVPALMRHLEHLEKESGTVSDTADQVKSLESVVALKREAFLEAARDLSSSRKKAADKLQAAMEKELKELAMAGASFVVALDALDEKRAGSFGMDRVEFLLASNPGEAPRPLARIASGGELSRVMLAIKAWEVDDQGPPTVIFDEVDAGIGGHTAYAVGSRLVRVARAQQVLCITHLHQIAAMADHHVSVRKTVREGRTTIEVKALHPEERMQELARMLGASPDSETAMEHVRKLVQDGHAGATS
ncbi:MAG: DNA repair protein RecN [Thermodesulfobacteriota bacterium]